MGAPERLGAPTQTQGCPRTPLLFTLLTWKHLPISNINIHTPTKLSCWKEFRALQKFLAIGSWKAQAAYEGEWESTRAIPRGGLFRLLPLCSCSFYGCLLPFG